jgi:hypothetical protein
MATIIAVGIVATVGVDIAAATTGSGPSAASVEHSYLAQLRPIALRVHDAVAPTERVLHALVEPQPGDAYAARDALVHGDALAGLQSAQVDLQKLTPPTQLAAQQTDLLSAAKLMEGALRGVRGLADASGVHLLNQMNQVSNGSLWTGEAKWGAALDKAFATGKLTPPPGLGSPTDRAPASRTAWIFGADRTCSAGSYLIDGASVQFLGDESLTAAETLYRRWHHAVAWIDQKLTALPKPSGATLPRPLEVQMRALGFTAGLYSQLPVALARADSTRIARLLNQLTEAKATLRGLSSGISRYGAKTCGLVIGILGGKRPSTTTRHSTDKT